MAWFEPSLPFVAGWGAPPQLHAPEIGGLVGHILQQRRYEQAQMQKNIADTIKNVRGEMQANKYLDSLKEANLVPQDYEAGGVGGATYGTGLAKMIQDKKEADALEAYRTGMLGVSQGHLGVAEEREQRLEDALTSGTTALPKSKLGQDIYRAQHPELELKLKTGMTQEELNPPGYAQIPGGGMGIGGKYKPPVQRESIQTDPNTKLKMYVPDAEGDYININGRRMKYNDYVRFGGRFGTASPTAEPAPAASGTGKTETAQGYGSDATSMSADQIRAEYRAGRMTEQEASARLKAIGFSD